jgi:hypothetical protein
MKSERQEARGKRQEARGKRQEARGKRQEARGKRQEAREVRGKRGKRGKRGNQTVTPWANMREAEGSIRRSPSETLVRTCVFVVIGGVVSAWSSSKTNQRKRHQKQEQE